MNYCAVNEAFDNSLKKQLAEYGGRNQNNNMINYQQDQEPEVFDNYNNLDVSAVSNNIFPAFFTAQGDYSAKGPYFGTDIKDLNNKNNLPISSDNHANNRPEESENAASVENLSFMDNNLSEESFIPTQVPKLDDGRKINHDRCINKMIKSLNEESDSCSMMSSDNGAVYNHVKKCKYCKTKINERIRKKLLNNYNPINTNIKPKEDPVFEYFDINHIGYNLKEILIIILAGIVLVFILDLLVKIGKKMRK
jgi:hypothetical protein